MAWQNIPHSRFQYNDSPTEPPTGNAGQHYLWSLQTNGIRTLSYSSGDVEIYTQVRLRALSGSPSTSADWYTQGELSKTHWDMVAANAGYVPETSSTWYVSPSGGSYGAEDGTSYADAWDGFENIDWTASGVQPGDTLYVCGTHLETLDVGGSGDIGNPIIISGDYAGDAGIIDSEDTRLGGMTITDKNYITIDSITSIDATISCFTTNGTSTGIIYNNCIGTGSGNQSYQHLGDVSVTLNNCIGNGSVDDGISLHDQSVVIANNCTFNGNAQGVGMVHTSNLTLNSCTLSGNTTENAVTLGDSTLVLDGCVIDGTQEISCDSTVQTVARNCLFLGSTNVFAEVGGDALVSECYFTDSSYVNSYGDVTVERCRFDTLQTAIATNGAGNALVQYSSFRTNVDLKYQFLPNSTGTFLVENCTVSNASNALGRMVRAYSDITIRNTICDEPKVAYYAEAGITITADHNNVYNPAFLTFGTGTVNETNAVTGDPLLVDPVNGDFSLDTGSASIGTGDTLTEATGVASAVWGNGVDETPVVTTKEQGASWDIGSYIS